MKLTTSTLGPWGFIARTHFNVGKGTKKYFSVQIGRKLGVGRELVGFNIKDFYKIVKLTSPDV